MTLNRTLAQAKLEAPRHFCVGGVYAKELHFLHSGQVVRSHKHAFDHLSLLVKGRVMVIADGISTEYRAPEGIKIRAGVEHEIMSMEPDTLWYCIHAVPEDLRGEDILDAAVLVSID